MRNPAGGGSRSVTAPVERLRRVRRAQDVRENLHDRSAGALLGIHDRNHEADQIGPVESDEDQRDDDEDRRHRTPATPWGTRNAQGLQSLVRVRSVSRGRPRHTAVNVPRVRWVGWPHGQGFVKKTERLNLSVRPKALIRYEMT